MKQRIEKLSIPPLRWLLSIFLFIASSCVYYSFFYVVRESMRLITISQDYDIWVLSDFEVWLWNIHSALLAVIMGISTSIIFIVNTPRTKHLNQLKRTSILNDQRFLQWSFLFFALEIFTSLGLSFGFVWKGAYTNINFSFELSMILLLVVIVLYLKQFNAIIRWIRIKPIMTYLWGWLFVVLFSLALSCINFYDYKKINDSVLRKNIPYNYEYIQPRSEVLQVWDSEYFLDKIFVVNDKNTETLSKPRCLYQFEEVSLSTLKSKLMEDLADLPFYEKTKANIRLHINSKTNMEFVNRLKYLLADVGITNMIYQVRPNNAEKNHGVDFYLLERLPNHLLPKSNTDIHKSFTKYSIHLTHDMLFLNQTKVNDLTVNDTLINLIIQNSPLQINLSYPTALQFEKYIFLRSQILSSYQTVRNQYSKRTYGKRFDFLDKKDQLQVRKRFPIIINDLMYESLMVQDND